MYEIYCIPEDTYEFVIAIAFDHDDALEAAHRITAMSRLGKYSYRIEHNGAIIAQGRTIR